jgi:heme-degrading monooxygenase HmoA
MSVARGCLPPAGAVAVIFVALRTPDDASGYGAAATQMEALAGAQPGYLGLDSARGADRLGVTVSYWADDASARAWKEQAEHALVREMGRAGWYEHYRVIVARVERGYGWASGVTE